MNKHRLGVSHRRGGLFYRLYFITVCHLHGGMLIASCDYLHIWKSTSICHVPPISHESVPPSPTNNCCLFTRWQAAPEPGDTCTLHPAGWHMWTSQQAHTYTLRTSHLAVSHPTEKKSPPLLHHRVFSRLQYTQCVLAPLTFACSAAFWEDSYGEALVSNEQEPINSNQSKRDYEVNYLCSLLG